MATSLDDECADYAMWVETVTTTGDEEWISVAVNIDGVVDESCGLRPKRESSAVCTASATFADPERLSQIIRFKEVVSGLAVGLTLRALLGHDEGTGRRWTMSCLEFDTTTWQVALVSRNLGGVTVALVGDDDRLS